MNLFIVSASTEMLGSNRMPDPTPADNRRCAYRVRPISTDNLALALVRDNRNHIPHEIADITCKGASVRFVKGRAPSLVKGDQILVSIESPNLDGKALITATVVFTGDSTTERLIGLAFQATGDLESMCLKSLEQVLTLLRL